MSSQPIQQQQERLEQRRYYLTVYIGGRPDYLLCRDKHGSLDEAVDCLKRQGYQDRDIEIREIVEWLVYDGGPIAYYDSEGKQQRRDFFYEHYFRNPRSIEYSDRLVDGASMSLVEIKRKVEKEEAERKAARKARRLANAAARKQDETQRKQTLAEKGGKR